MDELKITIIDIDDWVGVYKDGELKFEGHSIGNQDLLRIADVQYEVRYLVNNDYDEELFWGGMPSTLEGVDELLAKSVS